MDTDRRAQRLEWLGQCRDYTDEANGLLAVLVDHGLPYDPDEDNHNRVVASHTHRETGWTWRLHQDGLITGHSAAPVRYMRPVWATGYRQLAVDSVADITGLGERTDDKGTGLTEARTLAYGRTMARLRGAARALVVAL